MRVEVDPSRPAQVVNFGPPVTIATAGERMRNLWLTNGTLQNTADDTQLIANGTAVAACPAVDLATTDFSARDGDAYPFTAQGLTFSPVGALYNQAFEDYIVAPTSQGGLGGTITAAQYPELPPAGAARRITILGDESRRARRPGPRGRPARAERTVMWLSVAVVTLDRRSRKISRRRALEHLSPGAWAIMAGGTGLTDELALVTILDLGRGIRMWRWRAQGASCRAAGLQDRQGRGACDWRAMSARSRAGTVRPTIRPPWALADAWRSSNAAQDRPGV
jgi:hypothetical protein